MKAIALECSDDACLNSHPTRGRRYDNPTGSKANPLSGLRILNAVECVARTYEPMRNEYPASVTRPCGREIRGTLLGLLFIVSSYDPRTALDSEINGDNNSWSNLAESLCIPIS